jgi:hypothetical protein
MQGSDTTDIHRIGPWVSAKAIDIGILFVQSLIPRNR